jgi:hypothetical protein
MNDEADFTRQTAARNGNKVSMVFSTRRGTNFSHQNTAATFYPKRPAILF